MSEENQSSGIAEDDISALLAPPPSTADKPALRSRIKALQKKCEEYQFNYRRRCLEVEHYRKKTSSLAKSLRSQKTATARADSDVKVCEEKIAALAEHIEKLMIHLKHEATAKLKALNEARLREKEISILKDKTLELTKKNAAKKRLLDEVREGSKILEDQLRLMDQKYIELRGKLDWTRITMKKQSKRADAENTSLRQQLLILSESRRKEASQLPSGLSLASPSDFSLGAQSPTRRVLGRLKKRKKGKKRPHTSEAI